MVLKTSWRERLTDLSEAAATLPSMVGVDENTLLEWLDQEGITVHEIDMPDDMWGAYEHAEKRIYIQKDMPRLWRIATLTHEVIHAQNRHSGHQSQAIEDRINETVALLMVDPVDYAFYESQFGWCTGGIAHELGLPRWAIEAYRRQLSRMQSV